MSILVLPLCGLIREICQVQCINSRVLKQQSSFLLLGSVRIVEFRPEVDFLVSFLSLKMIVLVDWSLCVEGELLPQVKKFKYLRVSFTSGVTIEWEIDRGISAASAVMQTLYWPVVAERELSWRAKLSNYRSIFVPAFIWSWAVVTERMRLQMQVAEMGSLCQEAWLNRRDRCGVGTSWGDLRVKSLRFHIKSSQLGWFLGFNKDASQVPSSRGFVGMSN